MSYSFWRPPTLAPGGACPSDPPSYATDCTVGSKLLLRYFTRLLSTKAKDGTNARRYQRRIEVCIQILCVPFKLNCTTKKLSTVVMLILLIYKLLDVGLCPVKSLIG